MSFRAAKKISFTWDGAAVFQIVVIVCRAAAGIANHEELCAKFREVMKYGGYTPSAFGGTFVFVSFVFSIVYVIVGPNNEDGARVCSGPNPN